MTYRIHKHILVNQIVRGFFITLAMIIFSSLSTQSASAADFAVVTEIPKKVSAERTILQARLESSNNDAVYMWFEYGKNGKYEQSTNRWPVFRRNSFSRSVYNLEEGVTYIYRVMGENKKTGQQIMGASRYFTVPVEGGSSSSNNTTTYTSNTNTSNTQTTTTGNTGNTLVPVATAGGGTSVTNNTATLTGVVITGGSSAEGWFEWGETSGFGYETTHQTLPRTTQTITLTDTIGGLTSGKTYYYRTVAQTSAGTSYGTVTSFTTSGGNILSTLFGGGGNTNAANENQNVLLASAAGAGETALGASLASGGNIEKNTVGAFGWSRVLREQFFVIDENGDVTPVEEGFGKKQSGLASVFSSGILSFNNGILPTSVIGWIMWVVVIFVVITQGRRMVLDRQKRKDEEEQREEEMKELRRYQDAALSGKEKQPA